MRINNTNNFILKANEIHNFKYNYDISNYVYSKQKIIIICKIHGEFEQRPNDHLNGYGCPDCGKIQKSVSKTWDTTKFIKKAIFIHKKEYDYSVTSYINNKIKIKIICKKHGVFEQLPSNHLKGHKCSKCSIELNANNKMINYNIFLENANNIHNSIYEYYKESYSGMNKKIKIICKIHGIFIQKASDHIYSKSGCPKCKMSKGELKIIKYLQDNQINYISQYKIKECKNKRSLPFDFYFPEHNLLIEYDGRFHFEETKWNTLKDTQMKDNIKNQYCQQNNINLLRIKYTDFNNIENILKDNIK